MKVFKNLVPIDALSKGIPFLQPLNCCFTLIKWYLIIVIVRSRAEPDLPLPETPPAPPAVVREDLEPGSQRQYSLDDFELIRVIGRGSYAKVRWAKILIL